MAKDIGQHGCHGAPLHDACFGMLSPPFFHDSGPEPWPNEAHSPPVIDSWAERFPPSRPVNTVAVSTHLGIHDPAHPLLHAPLAELMPCLVGATSWPKALRAVVEVVLVDRCQQPGHRSVDHLVLARRRPHRTLPPVILGHPDTLDGRGLGAATAESLVPVAQGLVEVCGLVRRCHPIDPCGTRRARLMGRLPQNVCLNQGGQGRAHPVRIVGGLRRKALELWCDGW
jgi:hypothetical protein